MRELATGATGRLAPPAPSSTRTPSARHQARARRTQALDATGSATSRRTSGHANVERRLRTACPNAHRGSLVMCVAVTSVQPLETVDPGSRGRVLALRRSASFGSCLMPSKPGWTAVFTSHTHRRQVRRVRISTYLAVPNRGDRELHEPRRGRCERLRERTYLLARCASKRSRTRNYSWTSLARYTASMTSPSTAKAFSRPSLAWCPATGWATTRSPLMRRSRSRSPSSTSASCPNFAALIYQNPLIQRAERTHDGRPYRISDVVDQKTFHSLELYQEFYRHSASSGRSRSRCHLAHR